MTGSSSPISSPSTIPCNSLLGRKPLLRPLEGEIAQELAMP